MEITLTINGEKRSCTVEAAEVLADTLRRLGYAGVKKGCGEGTCGACAVILDGRLVPSCIVFSASADRGTVTTIEGIGTLDSPHPLQTEFVKAGAVQCGYCTPGMILAAKVLLDAQSNPTTAQIQQALDGNLCRCTGYVKIVEAVQCAARILSGDGRPRGEVAHD